MEKLFVGCQVVALCFALGQLASSYCNIWPHIRGSRYTAWEIFKGGARRKTGSGPPTRIIFLRFLIRVLRIFLTTAILALEYTQSNPRAAAVTSNTVTLVDSILEALQPFLTLHYGHLVEVPVYFAMVALKALFIYPYIPKLERFGFLSFGIPVGLDYIFQLSCTTKIRRGQTKERVRRIFLWNGIRCVFILLELAVLVPLSVFMTSIRLRAPQILQLSICLTPSMAGYKTLKKIWKNEDLPPQLTSTSSGNSRTGESHHRDGRESQIHLTSENSQMNVGSAADSAYSVKERFDARMYVAHPLAHTDGESYQPSVPRPALQKEIGVAV